MGIRSMTRAEWKALDGATRKRRRGALAAQDYVDIPSVTAGRDLGRR